MTALPTRTIHISLLRTDAIPSERPASHYTSSNFDILVQSIDLHGLVTELIVGHVIGTAEYHVLRGFLRLAAIQRLHAANPERFNHVNCLVLECQTMEELKDTNLS